MPGACALQGSVWVDASLAGERGLRLSVHDTGIGVPSALLGPIFDAFLQASTGSSRMALSTPLPLPPSLSHRNNLSVGKACMSESSIRLFAVKSCAACTSDAQRGQLLILDQSL